MFLESTSNNAFAAFHCQFIAAGAGWLKITNWKVGMSGPDCISDRKAQIGGNGIFGAALACRTQAASA
jgi:hypothetical protein